MRSGFSHSRQIILLRPQSAVLFIAALNATVVQANSSLSAKQACRVEDKEALDSLHVERYVVEYRTMV